MRKMLLLAATGAFLGVGAVGAQAQSILDRDVATQQTVATQQDSLGAPFAARQAIEGRAAYTAPDSEGQQPYADGNNFEPIHAGR